jgi:hypothetical protein
MNLDIVSLIESTPITRLSGTYQSKILDKVKQVFTENEQQMFVTSYYCYLNYHPTNDYVIDLDKVWQWLGFNKKYNAIRVLEKNFIKDKDYKCLLLIQEEQKKGRGGHNKETIMLNIKTFKLFCMKAGTKKAEQTHEYYVKLEDILHEVIQEETDELRLEFETYKTNTNQEKEMLRENTILEQFPKNSQCIYYGVIDNKEGEDEHVIKYGHSNHLYNRIIQHKKTYKNFRLMNAYRVENRTLIENEIKNHSELVAHKRIYTIEDVHYTELLANILPSKLDKVIKEIIMNIEYSPENYKILLEKSKKMTKENDELHIKNKEISKELHRIKIEFQAHLRKNPREEDPDVGDDAANVAKASISKISESPEVIEAETDAPEQLYERKKLRRFQKHKDGCYHIDGQTYTILSGTREQVWDNIAYRSEGNLTKKDFVINSAGKIVSKSKSILSKTDLRPFCKKKTTDKE